MNKNKTGEIPVPQTRITRSMVKVLQSKSVKQQTNSTQSCSKDTIPEVKQNETTKFKAKNTEALKKKGRTQPKDGTLKLKSMQGLTDEFIANEIVFATIPGYAPWPACIIEVKGNTFFVRFFGTDEMFVNESFIFVHLRK